MFTTLSFSRRAVSASATLLLVGGAVLCSAPQAHAQTYLVGALLFAANANGATTAPSTFQVDTNSSVGTTALDFTFNGTKYSKGISLLLPLGNSTLSFVQGAGNPQPLSSFGGTAGDLGLFFSTTNVSYNPSSGARTPDLLVSRATDGSTVFFFPTAGTTINDYVFPGSRTYSGATSVTSGVTPVTVTGFNVNDSGIGAVTLRAGAAAPSTPEPGSLALLTGLSLTGGLFLKRRRK